MKLLALRITEHDGSMCYYDNGKLRYLSYERLYGVKRHSYHNLWQWKSELKNRCGIDADELDEIAIVIGDDTSDFVDVENFDGLIGASCPVRKVNHHLAHAMSAWMFEPTDYQFIFDANGDTIHLGGNAYSAEVWTIYKDYKVIHKEIDENKNAFNRVGENTNFISLGNAYNNFCRELGYDDSDLGAEGKAMSLQSFGRFNEEYAEKFLMPLNIFDDKNLLLHFYKRKNWDKYKTSEIVGEKTILDWAHTVHKCTEKKLVEYFQRFAKPEDRILFAGGCAQNIVWNTEIKKHFPNLVVVPHSADEGLTLGAIEFLRRKNGLPEFNKENFPYWQDDDAPETTPTDETITYIANKLSRGKIVGWYQGHGEVGRRALGNRSILMHPMIPNGKEIINSRVKGRESYRPFGATVLKEHQDKYFEFDYDNPHMLYLSKLKIDAPAINHVDGTCRHQTLDDENPLYRKLIEEFYKITGYPFVLNTSLNLGGRPIAGNKTEALAVFYESDLDILVYGDEIFDKDNL